MILKLNSVTKDYIWGGTRLRDEFGKIGGNRLAESWELSVHPDGMSTISGGEYDGMTLAAFIEKFPESTGKNSLGSVPILIKLIDAKDNLSVQVHPDNDYARKYEGDNGKTETWYIVDCDENASIIYGFKDKLTKEEFRAAIADNTLLDKVNVIPVNKGDVFLIRAGTLHAIGKGCLIAEIQQSSNVTYRVYDYDRRDDAGNPRELHIEKALDSAYRNPTEIPVKQRDNADFQQASELVSCEYFTVFREDISGSGEIRRNDNSFTHILIIEGRGEIISDSDIHAAEKGESFFVTAGTEWHIKGNCSIIYTVV